MCGFPLSFPHLYPFSIIHSNWFKFKRLVCDPFPFIFCLFLPFTRSNFESQWICNGILRSQSRSYFLCPFLFSSESFCSFYVTEWTISNFRDGTAADSEQTQTNSIGKCLDEFKFYFIACLFVSLSAFNLSYVP